VKEVISMARHWEDREKMKASLGSSGLAGHVCWFMGAVFAVLGIIAGAMNASLGLSSTEWLLLALVTFVAGIPFFFGLGLGWYLKIAGSRKKD
jgi:hypothetical protein